MKLNARDAAAFVQKPDPGRAGVLIYGADAMRVALKRQELLLALLGPNAEEEMRLARMSGAELRQDGARLDEAMRSQGFFPGPRAALVEGATDGLAPVIKAALESWQDGDGTIVATAGQLTPRGALRKLFEGAPNAVAIAVYDDPPSEAEITAMLERSGITGLEGEGRGALLALSRSLEPGDFRQTLEKLALYKLGDAAPISVADVEACAPRSSEADLDELIAIVATAQQDRIAAVLRRLYAQGVTPVTLCIGLTRHFRRLHAAASDPEGPSRGLARLRPPVFGPRQEAMARQIRMWGRARLEGALSQIIETDLRLRSPDPAPEGALVERLLIRLARMPATR